VLSEHVLYYFDSPGEDKPKLILPMDAVRVGRSATKDLELQILPAGQNGCGVRWQDTRCTILA
jgi:hypothetical protein